MKKEESNINNGIQTETNNAKDQDNEDQHGQSLEDKIEAMLKLNWVMLPESCSIPCNIC